MTISRLSSITLCVVLGTVTVSTTQAGAVAPPLKSRPSISWSFANPAIDAGNSPTVNYRVGKLPSRTKLVLQRQFGTSGTWRTVAALQGRSGSFVAPTVGQGKYAYRVAVQRKKKVLAKRPGTLYAYAPVSLQTFLNISSSQTTEIGGRLFRWVKSWNALTSSTVFSVDSHTCRSLSLEAGLTGGNSETAIVEIVQEAADPASMPLYKDQVSTVQVPLAPGALEVSHSRSAYGFLNGELSCYTPDGE